MPALSCYIIIYCIIVLKGLLLFRLIQLYVFQFEFYNLLNHFYRYLMIFRNVFDIMINYLVNDIFITNSFNISKVLLLKNTIG